MDRANYKLSKFFKFSNGKIELASRLISSNAFLVSILIFAAALRIAHLLALRHLPLFDNLILDSQFYDGVAQRIAAGDWLNGDHVFYTDPLYPYVVALIYRFVGHDVLVVRLFQVTLGVMTCGLVAVIGRRVGGKTVGNLAALMLAVYKPAIFQEVEFEKTALGVFLITLSLMFAMRKSFKAHLAAGICLGLASLARGNMLMMAPIGALYFLTMPTISKRAVSPAPHVGIQMKDRLIGQPGLSAAVFLLGFFVALGPIIWRNYWVSGELILTTYQAGANFYTGNNPANGTGVFQNVPFVRPQTIYEENDFKAEAEARSGRRLSPSEVSSFWFKEGLKHITAHPGFAARVIYQKFALFWSDYEVTDAWDMYFLRRYSPVMAMPLLGMGLLLPLAVLGVLVGFRKSRDIRLLTGYVIVYSISVIIFFVFSRYRIYVVPALAVLAASPLSTFHHLVLTRDWRRVFTFAMIAVLIAVFSFFGVRSFLLVDKNGTQSFINLADLYIDKGDFPEAERLLQEAPANSRTDRAARLHALGWLRLKTGDYMNAIDFFDRCIQEDPEWPNAFYHLGLAYEKMGMWDKAEKAYEMQLRIIPGHDDARFSLMNLRSGRKSPDRVH
jgi:tetratricopeptide (TPR) repeat protein